MKRIILYILLAFLGHDGLAQDATVAYKVENYDFLYSPNLKIKTNCEMADIIFVKGSGDKVIIKCTYSAKHVDKLVASKELGRHNIRVKKTLNEIFISNYFTVQKGETEPKAKLNVKFEISIPQQVHLETDNNFGSTLVENLSIRGTIQQDYGKLELKKVIANVDIQGKLCDMQILQSKGMVRCSNKSGDITVEQFSGKELQIKNTNAQLKLMSIQPEVALDLDLSNCSLTCSNMSYNQRSLDISSYKEPIKTASSLNVSIKNNYYTILTTKNAPLLKIKATYSKINLN